MATRSNTFLLKRSNVAGKVPSNGDLILGELALNTADVKLYSSGTTQNQILQIGWDRLSTESGGTVNASVNIIGDLTVSGSTTVYTADGSELLFSIDKTGSNDIQFGRTMIPDANRSLSIGDGTHFLNSIWITDIRLGDNSGNDAITITAPSDVWPTSPDPVYGIVVPQTTGATGTFLGVYNYDGANRSHETGWFSLIAGSNITLDTSYAASGSSITINGSGGSADGVVTGSTLNGTNLELSRTQGLSTLVTDLSSLSTTSSETIIAGENLVNGDLVYLSTNGKYYKASNASESTASTELRIVTETINTDSTGNALVEGQFTTSGLTSGSTYWIGATTGSWTSTQPTGDGNIVRYIGTALNETTLIFNPDALYIEISSSSGPSTQPGYREVTTSDNILITDFTVDVSTTGNTTQTLPLSTSLNKGKVWNVKNSDYTETSLVTVSTTSGQSIDRDPSVTSVTLSFPESLTFQSTGSGYIII